VTIAERAVRKPAEREGSSYSGNTYEEPEYTHLKSLGKLNLIFSNIKNN
jgi:hypothetical protein